MQEEKADKNHGKSIQGIWPVDKVEAMQSLEEEFAALNIHVTVLKKAGEEYHGKNVVKPGYAYIQLAHRPFKTGESLAPFWQKVDSTVAQTNLITV